MTPRALPWRRPQHELLLLTLVGFAALTPVYVVNAQDVSHFCLTRAMAAGELTIDTCGGDVLDRSSYKGHSYSNKAPGISATAGTATPTAASRPVPAT